MQEIEETPVTAEAANMAALAHQQDRQGNHEVAAALVRGRDGRARGLLPLLPSPPLRKAVRKARRALARWALVRLEEMASAETPTVLAWDKSQARARFKEMVGTLPAGTVIERVT